MNTRTRQWLKASAMLDRVDKLLMASVPYTTSNGGHIKLALTFRRSDLPKMRKKYGNDLKIIIGGDT